MTKTFVIVGVAIPVIFATINGFFKLATNKKVKRKPNTHYPYIQVYPLDNDKTKELWRDNFVNCNYIYRLNKTTYDKVMGQDSSPTKGKTAEKHFGFLIINKNELDTSIESKSVFAMVFRNSKDDALLITEINTQDGLIHNIENKSRLARLNQNESVCLICDKKDLPLEFGGSFKSDTISYKVNSVSTCDIYSTSHSKKTCHKLFKKKATIEIDRIT